MLNANAKFICLSVKRYIYELVYDTYMSLFISRTISLTTYLCLFDCNVVAVWFFLFCFYYKVLRY